MTREPAEPMRLDCLIKAGAIHAMTGDRLDSQALPGVAAQQTERLRNYLGG